MRYGIIVLTEGNLRNDHLYLSTVMDLFPPMSIGGSSEARQAALLLEIHSGIDEPVQTDIAGDKKIFRRRACVGEFFAKHELRAGDRVVVERTGPNRYHVYPARG